jgi:prepilin-type N-terminal cleavage/methylation domain-containing protein
MKKGRGFTLVELMVVILIVAILAAVAIPILRGRIDAAKWSEGKAMIGTIATAIRAYHAEKGPQGDAPTDLIGSGDTELGFTDADLTGTYFTFEDFSIGTVTMTPTLTFTVTCTAGHDTDAPEYPASWTLDQEGEWTPG